MLTEPFYVDTTIDVLTKQTNILKAFLIHEISRAKGAKGRSEEKKKAQPRIQTPTFDLQSTFLSDLQIAWTWLQEVSDLLLAAMRKNDLYHRQFLRWISQSL